MTRAAHPSTEPARPYFASLRAAVEAFLRDSDNDRSRLKPEKWADTYRCSIADVSDEFDRQLSAASLKPSNTYDVEGK